MEYESDGDTNCNWCTWSNPQRIGKGTGRLENKRISKDLPDNSITEIGQNTEKSPETWGNLLSLTPQKNPLK